MEPDKPLSQEEGNSFLKDRVSNLEERIISIEKKLKIDFRNKLIELPKIGVQIAEDVIKVFPDEETLRREIKENKKLPFKKIVNEVLEDNFNVK